jgi:hypothetical protein
MIDPGFWAPSTTAGDGGISPLFIGQGSLLVIVYHGKHFDKVQSSANSFDVYLHRAGIRLDCEIALAVNNQEIFR